MVSLASPIGSGRLVVSSKYEEISEREMISEDRSTNDYVDAAVNDLSVQGIEC